MIIQKYHVHIRRNFKFWIKMNFLYTIGYQIKRSFTLGEGKNIIATL